MTDDDLRSRLRRADPAASLASPAPEHTSRLVARTMTTTAPTRVTGRRQPLMALAAAALVLIAAGGTGWLLNRPTAAVVNLTAAQDAKTRCAQPTAQDLATSADFAFGGTVTGIAGSVVTLKVTHKYKGSKANEVRVTQTSDSPLGSGRLEIGKKYLIASSAGGVKPCGYSGEANSPGLRDLYDNAF